MIGKTLLLFSVLNSIAYYVVHGPCPYLCLCAVQFFGLFMDEIPKVERERERE